MSRSDIDFDDAVGCIRDLTRLCDEQHAGLHIALGVLSRKMKDPDELEPARRALENGELSLMKLKAKFDL